ncbi:helicase RepA family protein [Sphingobium sp. 3R8]|uniref:AAA family ATPase n=1 Tax=Sphingobium sp. 3R8 TaxID=2874921 RepID=UPI001CCCD72C|nr:AAA family ATPase [Sphingobium sp. 3R8]MBZ9649398.1 helicase RepA family protein [Sphingobium sp. 3R8]
MTVARDFEDDEREFGGASVRAALDAARWPGPERPPSNYGMETSPAAIVSATPFTWREPSSIPRRQFLYGYELRRKQVSAVIAPGAAGKTTYKVGRALCIATGRNLLNTTVWNGPHRVWLWNLEDEMEEVEKTVHAFMKAWDITPDDLGDRLFLDGVDSASSGTLKLAVEEKTGGFTVRKPVAEAVIEEMKRNKVDYLDIDPFVSSHSVDENNNGAIDAVTKEWVRIAHETNSAVSLAHHVRKPNGSEASAFDARGAVSMINAARSCLVFQKMTKEVAEEFRIPECDRKRFFSVYDDKNNKAPAPSAANWFQFVGVGLGNGDDTGPEDNIGAIECWEAPDTFAGVTARQLYHIQREIDAAPGSSRKHSASTLWAGKLVAKVLDVDPHDDAEKRRINKMITVWIREGALKVVERKTGHDQMKEFVEVGRWLQL